MRTRKSNLQQNGSQHDAQNGEHHQNGVEQVNGSLEEITTTATTLLPSQSVDNNDKNKPVTNGKAPRRGKKRDHNNNLQTTIEVIAEDDDEGMAGSSKAIQEVPRTENHQDEAPRPTKRSKKAVQDVPRTENGQDEAQRTSKRSKKTIQEVPRAEEGSKEPIQDDPRAEDDDQESVVDDAFYDAHGYPGHIECLKLHQFMCHDKFEFKFNPRVNVINGENGSGKSAVLTAIMLIFGSKASGTSRAKNIKDFIKSGQTFTQIDLTLCNYNRPQDEKLAYRPEVYGKTILIQRRITDKGVSTLWTKTGTGSLVESKKAPAEVKNICQHFRINVNNPATVLTQEVSKHFLNSKNPSDIFRFFNQATDLELIEENYNHSKKDLDTQESRTKDYREVHDRTLAGFKELEAQMDILNVLQNNENIIQNLENELEWAKVNDLQKALDKLEDEGRKQDFDKVLERLDKKEKEHKESFQKAEKDRDDCRMKQTEFRERIDELKRIHEDHKEENERKEKEYKNAIKDLKAHEAVAERIEVGLKKHQEELRNAEKEKKSDFEAQLERISESMTDRKCRLDSQNEEIANVCKTDDELKAQEKAIEKLTNELKELTRKRQEIEKEIQSFSKGPIHKSRYIPEMERLKKAVKETEFKDKVYGPLADYITVKDNKDAYLVEKILGPCSTAFLATDKNDFELLKRLTKEAFPVGKKAFPPRLFHRKRTNPIDLTGKTAEYLNFRSVWDLLEVSEPEVINCLIDNTQIERKLCIPDSDSAHELALKPGFDPKNCQQVHCLNGDMIMFKPFRSYPDNKPLKMSKYFNANPEWKLESLKANLGRIKDQFDELIGRQNGLKRDLAGDRAIRKEKTTVLQGLKAEVNNLKAEKAKIEKKIAAIEAIDYEEMRRKIQSIQESLKDKETELKEAENRKNDLCKEYNDHIVMVNKAKNDYNKQLTLDKFDKKLENHNKEIDKIQKRIQDIQVHKGVLTGKRDDLRERVEEAKKKTDAAVLEAYSVTEQEVPTSRTAQEVQLDLAKRRAELTANGDIWGRADEIRQQYAMEKEKNDSITKIMEQSVERWNFFNEATTRRKRALTTGQNVTKLNMEAILKLFLKKKDMTGSVEIDYEKRTLDLVSMPATGSQPGPSNGQKFFSLKTLSGGERSFSTVAFIVSIWKIADKPFRILDEVDVFMDDVTRATCIKILVDFAENFSNRQFLFLSPLTIRELKPSAKVKVFQMPRKDT